MKKNLLFAMLAFSVTVLAQNNSSTSGTQSSHQITLENLRGGGIQKKISLIPKYTESASTQFAGITSFKQNTSSQRIDSVYRWHKDGPNAEWVLSLKVINTYDNNDDLKSKQYENWYNNNWEKAMNTYTWDSNHNMTSKTYQYWIGNDLVIENRYEYTYDANHNIKSEWYSYNWNGSSWVEPKQNDYTYDENNNLITFTLLSGWDGNSWLYSKPVHLYILAYDANNNLESKIQQRWDTDYSFWRNMTMTTYTYATDNTLASELFQFSSLNSWVNGSKTSYSYDTNKNIITRVIQYWNESYWDSRQQMYNYTYDTNNFIISELLHGWNNGIEIADSTYYYYNTDVATLKLVAKLNTDVVPSNELNYHLYLRKGNSFLLKNIKHTDRGDTAFFSVPQGDWIVLVSSNQNPAAFLPTYVGNVIDWSNADNITIPAQGSIFKEISCIQAATVGIGTGQISGNIYENNEPTTKSISIINSASETGNPITGALIQLYKMGGTIPSASAFSDSLGYYKFDQLEIMDYEIAVEIPGFIQSEKFSVSVSESKPTVSLKFGVNTRTQVITDANQFLLSSFTIYPNPSGGKITISSRSNLSSIEIYNLLGERLFSNLNINNNTIETDLSKYGKGIYLIKIQIGIQNYSAKVIVQ